ncbi:MAG: Crp/Fnr family transcriptional regulator [Bacteroidia bacterium]
MDSIRNAYPNFESELITEIDSTAITREVKAGEILLKTGQYIQDTILVLQGKIKIFREDQDGNEFFMYYLTPGQACALSMICAAKMETSKIMAIATEDSKLLMLPLNKMENWMSNYKSWYSFVVNTYRDRFEEMLLVLDQVAFRSMDERLEFYLKRQAEILNKKHIHLTHQEIANDLNSSREVISRLLKKMEQRGLLTLHRNDIELHIL